MDFQGLTFPTNLSKKTSLASFGPLFSRAGYKMGYKEDAQDFCICASKFEVFLALFFKGRDTKGIQRRNPGCGE